MTDQPLQAPDADALRRWLPPERPAPQRDPLLSRDAAAAWNGVVWGRLGRGDLAWAWFDAVEDPQLVPWIEGERGRILRELGLHAHAEAHDEDGLAAAHDMTDVVLLRLSLAADAVGLRSTRSAGLRLASASTLLDELKDSPRAARQRLRRVWVGVEVAMLEGRQPRADGLPGRGSARPLFSIDHDHGTDFHRAKGLMFAGVVREDPGLLKQGSALAPAGLRWAIELARLDAGDAAAAARAVTAWDEVVPPPHVTREVADTPTARRIASLRDS